MKTALFDCEWAADDDSRLLRGVYEFGLGNWDAVKMDDNLQLHNKVSFYDNDLAVCLWWTVIVYLCQRLFVQVLKWVTVCKLVW